MFITKSVRVSRTGAAPLRIARFRLLRQGDRALGQARLDPRLRERMEAVLAACHECGVTLITNMGAANPHAAAVCVRDVTRRAGLTDLTIAVVTGDDVTAIVSNGCYRSLELDEPF